MGIMEQSPSPAGTARGQDDGLPEDAYRGILGEGHDGPGRDADLGHGGVAAAGRRITGALPVGPDTLGACWPLLVTLDTPLPAFGERLIGNRGAAQRSHTCSLCNPSLLCGCFGGPVSRCRAPAVVFRRQRSTKRKRECSHAEPTWRARQRRGLIHSSRQARGVKDESEADCARYRQKRERARAGNCDDG